MEFKIFECDPTLLPYKNDIELRISHYITKRSELLEEKNSISDFANGHHYFGIHKTENGWIYREWAHEADEVYLTGDMVGWNWFDLKLTPLGNGCFEIYMPGKDFLYGGCRVKTIIKHKGSLLERIPLYIRYTCQDPQTAAFCGVVTDEEPYEWKSGSIKPSENPCIYECHIGMSGEKEGISTYDEFRLAVLPRIKSLGYNTLQIMAIMEHPYYGSFGYQVSSFFAASSRYGTPNALKRLIDAAHQLGIAVLLDVVHSHAVKNTAEGINEFDGTSYQFFHEGKRGDHPTWGTKLFNYEKNEVIHFLLSNLKFWMEEYHFDGFRFDGVTSMIYHDHGLGVSFTDYGKYFSSNTDVSALTYLTLANELIKEINPLAITVAEDMSGMPGMCLPISYGGIGFDFRLAMGLPDLWIKCVKEIPYDNWDMWQIWHELTDRRRAEKYIAYAESHDQALVGDKTLMFRLCDSKMYTEMEIGNQDPIIWHGMARIKLIRLLTATLGGEGYLNFMGNEFGHPEWVDFPREGNGWSYFYCRRQWHLADDERLKYSCLNKFDRAMINLLKKKRILSGKTELLKLDNEAKIIAFRRGGKIFIFNFNPTASFEGYEIPVMKKKTELRVIFSTDDAEFGGDERISKEVEYQALCDDGKKYIKIYLPSSSAVCLY